MDLERKVEQIDQKLDHIAREQGYQRGLLEEKLKGIDHRVGKLEKGSFAILIAFVASVFAWFFKR